MGRGQIENKRMTRVRRAGKGEKVNEEGWEGQWPGEIGKGQPPVQFVKDNIFWKGAGQGHTYIYIQTYIYTYIHINMYIHTYIYTDIHA